MYNQFMDKIRIGIIGTGGIAENCHAPAIQDVESATLRAVLSREEPKGMDFLTRHGAANGKVYTTLEDFAADPDIDMVIVCSPDKLHAQQAKACLIASKHVLLEKPMATTVEEAHELVELAKSKDVTLATGFHLRSHAGHRQLYERVVKRKELGDIRHIRIIWASPQEDDSNWRASEDLGKWWSLAAVGSHCLDQARWFGNDDNDWQQFAPVIANNIWQGPHDETAVLAGQFASGPTVEVVSSVQFGPYTRLEIFGQKGIAIYENTLGREGAGRITINDQPLTFEPISPFIPQLQDFVDCIQNKTTPRAGGNVGLRSVQDLLLAYDA